MGDLLVKRENEVSGLNQYSVILAGSEIKVRRSFLNFSFVPRPTHRVAIRGRGGYQEVSSDLCYVPPSGNCFVSLMRHNFPEMNGAISKWFTGAKRSLFHRGLTQRNVTDFIKYLNGHKSNNNFGLEAFILSFGKKSSNCVHVVPEDGKRIKRQIYLYLHRDFDLSKRHHWISLNFNPLYKKVNGKYGNKYTYKEMSNELKPYLIYCEDDDLNLSSGEVISHSFLQPYEDDKTADEEILTLAYDVESYFDCVEQCLVGMYQRFRIKSDAEIHVPFACGYSKINFDGGVVESYSPFYGLGCLRRMMVEISDLGYGKVFLYAHNSACYDNYLVITDLLDNPEIDSKDISIVKTARGLISLSVTFRGVRFIFRDTYLHMSSLLK